MRTILKEAIIGMAISAVIVMITFIAIGTENIALPFVEQTGFSDMNGNLVKTAIFCGIFVYGITLMYLKSWHTIAAPLVLSVVLITYTLSNNVIVSSILYAVLWITSILLISLGIIPAYISVHFFQTASLEWNVVLSMVFGMPIGILICRMIYNQWPWYTYWFYKTYEPTAVSRVINLIAHLFRKPVKKYHYSGSSSYDYSGSSSTGSSASDLGMTCRSYNAIGDYTGESESDGLGGARHYDIYGSYTGRSESDGLGGSRSYDKMGRYTGSSEPDGLGGFRHYDELGNYIGTSEPDGLGGYRRYNKYGDYIGKSES